MATENLDININVDTEGATGPIKSFREQLREATKDVITMSEKFGGTSKEAINAAKKVAELRDRLGDAKSLSDAFNPDAKFKALTSSLSGVAGGFGAVQGAMALFGAESDNVQKTLLKVQSAMAISQGLQGIGESIDSFKQLGAVIKQTSVYQAAYNFIMDDTAQVTKEAVVEIEAQTIALEGEAVATTQVATATTGATIALRIFRAALIATGIGAAVVAIGLLVSYFNSLTNATKEAREAKEKLDKAYVEGSKKAYSKYLEDFDSLKEIELAKAGDNENKKFKIEDDFRKKKIAALEKQYKEIEGKDVEAEGEIQNKIAKLRNEGTINSYEKDKRLKKELEEKKIQDAVDAALAEKKAIDDELAAYEKRKKRSDKLNKDFIGADGLTNEEREKAKKDEKDRKEKNDKETQEFNEKSLKDGLGKTLSIKAEALAAGWKQDEDNLAAKKRIDELEVESKQASANAIGDIAAGLSSILGQETATGKAVAIASATIDTYLSASTIFKQASKNPITIANPAYPYLMAAPAVLAGIARVKSIVSVPVPNGGGGGSMPSMSSAAPLPPQIPTAQVTQLNQQSINDIGNNAVRAYVVESDVTSSQERITAIRQRARFS